MFEKIGEKLSAMVAIPTVSINRNRNRLPYWGVPGISANSLSLPVCSRCAHAGGRLSF